jgi:raffinose/stachyose/melibiose transport system substrate-binding protein
MPTRRILKISSLALILVVGVVLLRPPDIETEEFMSPRSGRSDARYVIKVDPGDHHMPGTRPFGLGEPLRGFYQVGRLFEQRFPDTRIEMITVPTLREYLVTQLSSGAAPDIVSVNVEDVWVDVQKGWYVPLDRYLNRPNPFVVEMGEFDAPGSVEWWDMFKYQALSRGKAAPDGKNYCLTLSAVETGIFYNKTFFREHGLEEPRDWVEFLNLLQAIKDAGRIPLLVGLDAFSDWGTDLIFDQLYYDLLPGIDLVKDPAREVYLEGYLDGEELAFLFSKGFFTRDDPRWVEMTRLIKELRPYLPRNLADDDFMREFLTQQGILMWTSSQNAFPVWVDKDLGFEWDVFYPPPMTAETTSFAVGRPMCVIGGAAQQYEVTNSALADTDPNRSLEERIEKSERLKRVIAFLQFLSLPENTDRVVNEYPSFLPNIVGVEGLPELKPFEAILGRRYTTSKWVFSFDLRFYYTMNRMLGLFLEDGIDMDGYLRWQEDNIRSSGNSLVRRQAIDLGVFERRWNELAPVRAQMNGLPGPGSPGK